jgi:hypothetical protein
MLRSDERQFGLLLLVMTLNTEASFCYYIMASLQGCVKLATLFRIRVFTKTPPQNLYFIKNTRKPLVIIL